ncbi:sugar phosphate nucleotidyltransferase [Ferrimonas senticii]|uniref:sugar phosphate nucleotidyltransferase n=1 Tax=Ferrimonas senticii TaxID=394566 RepID=UPI000429AEFF|nr:NDP-sugar synthase [Ferrimonas senticii]
MRGMILGAGKGTRVKPITFNIPKPMIPILRRPLMESIILQLRKFGINELVINTSYLAPVLENYFRDGLQYGVDLCYSYEGQKVDGKLVGKALGSAGGLKKVQDYAHFFDDTFVVVCGDAWFDLDFAKAVEFHRRKGGLATIITKEMPDESLKHYGVVAVDDMDRVVGFQEKPPANRACSNQVNTGIYLFEPEIFNFIPANTVWDIGADLFPELVRLGIPFYAKTFDFQWLDVGNVNDIWQVTADILLGKVHGYPIPGKEEAPGVFVGINCQLDLERLDIQGPVVIGNGTRIETGAVLRGPLVIGQNCYIQAGATLKHSILDDYTFVSGAANVDQRILHGEHCIDHQGNHFTLEQIGAKWILQDTRERYVPDQISREFLRAASGVGDDSMVQRNS